MIVSKQAMLAAVERAKVYPPGHGNSYFDHVDISDTQKAIDYLKKEKEYASAHG